MIDASPAESNARTESRDRIRVAGDPVSGGARRYLHMISSSRRSRTATIVIAAIAPLGAASMVATSAQGSSVKTVHIKNIDFSPRTLHIARGTTVRWLFQDANTPHNVTSRGRTKFRNSHTKQSGSYAFRFTKTGTYKYVCTIHLNMKGTIVVR